VNKIKKVLLALDDDPGEEKIARIGSSMAKAMNDKVILLHVVSGQMYYSATEYYLKIGNNTSFDPESLPPHPGGQEKQASQYFLILGK